MRGAVVKLHTSTCRRRGASQKAFQPRREWPHGSGVAPAACGDELGIVQRPHGGGVAPAACGDELGLVQRPHGGGVAPAACGDELGLVQRPHGGGVARVPFKLEWNANNYMFASLESCVNKSPTGACKAHGGGRRCQEEGCLKSARGDTGAF
jgi:hypothetical protein